MDGVCMPQPNAPSNRVNLPRVCAGRVCRISAHHPRLATGFELQIMYSTRRSCPYAALLGSHSRAFNFCTIILQWKRRYGP